MKLKTLVDAGLLLKKVQTYMHVEILLFCSTQSNISEPNFIVGSEFFSNCDIEVFFCVIVY